MQIKKSRSIKSTEKVCLEAKTPLPSFVLFLSEKNLPPFIWLHLWWSCFSHVKIDLSSFVLVVKFRLKLVSVNSSPEILFTPMSFLCSVPFLHMRQRPLISKKREWQWVISYARTSSIMLKHITEVLQIFRIHRFDFFPILKHLSGLI